MTSWKPALICAMALFVSACGGGKSDDSNTPPPPPNPTSVTLGGTITGLIGTLQLQLAADGVSIGTQNITNGTFTLGGALALFTGESYALRF